MAYVRIDDAAMDHPKILELSDAQLCLWLRGLCYCQKHLTDGFLTDTAIKSMRAKAGDAKRLCELVLWEAAPGGFLVHDYLDWNDSRDMTVHRKRRAKDRQETWRVKHVTNAPQRHVSNGVTNGVTNGVPHLTSPHLSTKKDPTASALSAPPTNRGSQHGRIFVHPWQLHALIDTLGPHASNFGLDQWVFSLSALADSKGLILEKKEVWGWVQQQLSDEVRRRGLPIAGAAPSADDNLARMRAEIEQQNALVRRA